MRRWVVGVGGAAVLVVAAVVLALHNAGRWVEAHRDWIDAQASDALGRSVSFGRVGVALFPSVAVRVEDVRIGDDPAWSAEPFVTAHAVDVRVALLPALFGRVEVRRVVLDTPVVTVIHGAAGRNVDSLGRRPGIGAIGRGNGAHGRGRREGAAPAAAAQPAPSALPLAIMAGSVRNGALRLVERRRGHDTVAELRDVDATVGGVAAGRAARIDARAALPGSKRQNVRIAGTVGPLMPDAIGRTPVDVELHVDGLDLAQLRAAVPGVAAAVPRPLDVTGPVDTTIAVSGMAGAPVFDARIDATRAKVDWAEWFAKAPGVPLAITGKGRRAGTGAHLDTLVLHLAALEASGRGDASPERVALHLEAAPAALAPLAALVPAVAAWDVGGAVGLRVDADGPVTKGRTPALRGTVTVREVSIASRDPAFEVSGLTQTITLDGDTATIPATTLRVNGEPVVLSAHLGRFGSPVLALSDLALRIFGGRIHGGVEFDRTTPAHPRVGATLRIDGVDVAAATRHGAPGIARNLAGRLSGDVRLAGRGATAAALRTGLTGDGHVAVDDGVLRGVNVVDSVLAGVTQVPGLGELVPRRLREKYPAVFGGEDTRFDELSADWRLAGGALRLDRVAVAARDFGLDGRGTLGLDGRLAATGDLQLSRGLSDDVVRATRVASLLRDGRGRVVVPFAVEGTWPRVRVAPDAGALARAVQGGALQQGVDRLLEGLFKKR
jgi:uncharacterized protein involved in outer membrane biogenesis